MTALDQTAQQISVGCDTARAQPPVRVGDVADTLERVTIDDRRHRDRDPLLARALTRTGLPATRPAFDPFVTVVVDRADVRLVAQQPVKGRGSPQRLAGRRRDPAVAQRQRDLANRQSPLDVRVEDPAHGLGLGLVDLDPRPPALGIDDAAVPVGGLPERDLAGAGAVQLAAAVAFGDLGFLVLGDHALHLDQQRRLRIVAGRRAFQEPDGDSETLELLEDQNLVGVGPCEAINAQAHHPVEHARLGGIAQTVKRRAIQPCAGVTIVDELFDHFVTISLRRRAQRLELRADRAALLLALGRHACIEPDPHSPTARNTSP